MFCIAKLFRCNNISVKYIKGDIKMKKFIIAFLAAVLLTFCFAACKTNNTGKPDNTSSQVSASEEKTDNNGAVKDNNGIIGDEEDKTKGDTSKSIVSGVVSDAGSTVQDIGNNVGSTIEDIGEGVGSTVEDIGEGAGSVVEDIGEGAGKITQDVTGNDSSKASE